MGWHSRQVEHLSEAQLGELRAALEGEVSALRARIDAREFEAKAQQDDVERQDQAAREQLRSVAVAGATHDRARLQAVEAALLRMQEGSYGICEETDEEIPFARLRAEPTARYTVEGLEQLEADGRREVETQHDPGAY